jgi:hypothetical protein
MLASADLATDHPGLIGSHREFFIREFLAHFLPGRLSADRGIVYNFMDRSGECDVVVWDSANFPRLSMLDHSSFFVESVVCIIEVKSNYSKEEFVDCLSRNRDLRTLALAGTHPDTFENEFELLWGEVMALRDQVDYHGLGSTLTPIGYGVVFLRGGGSVTLSDLFADEEDLQEAAPDFVTFVDAGISFHKHVPDYNGWEEGETAHVTRFLIGDDVLLDLADRLLGVIRTRSFATDGFWGLGPYTPWAFQERHEMEQMPFPITRFPAGRRHFYGETGRDPESA